MKPSDWEVFGRGSPPHIIPLGDAVEHELTMSCWCCPTREDWVIVHHSLECQAVVVPEKQG